MKNKILIFITAVVVIVVVIYILVVKGILVLPTIGMDSETKTTIISADDLEDGCYYIWHNSKSTIQDDLQGTMDEDAFKICPQGIINWNENANVAHTIWFTSISDIEIPTLYPGDKLIYVSSTKVPYEGIKWERYADYGYTIGVANMISDSSGHYRIVADLENGYEGFINMKSDAAALAKYEAVSELFLDKIGNVPVRENLVSEGGTILGLEKNGKYICEWYTGTYFQDYEMTANNHTFCYIEGFTTYDYEFLHSRCVSITIPEWFKTGYYFVEGVGFFRYVSMEDLSVYNGSVYDENVNWNDPIILYDERNLVIYDPSVGIDKRTVEQKNANTKTKAAPKTTTKQSTSNANSKKESDEMQDDGDLGADYYEDFYEEHYVE